MDVAGIIIVILFGLVIGLIVGGVWMIFSIRKLERQVKNPKVQEKTLFEVKESPKTKVKEKVVVAPQEVEVKPVENPKQLKLERKQFDKANKILAKEKIRYEKGKVSYADLEQKFKYFQSQPYYINEKKRRGLQ